MSGARPLYLSSGFILEEGFAVDDLKKILSSMRDAAAEAGVTIVTGDTKVVQKGGADKIFINTSGNRSSSSQSVNLSATRAQPGDRRHPEWHTRRSRHDDHDRSWRVGSGD